MLLPEDGAGANEVERFGIEVRAFGVGLCFGSGIELEGCAVALWRHDLSEIDLEFTSLLFFRGRAWGEGRLCCFFSEDFSRNRDPPVYRLGFGGLYNAENEVTALLKGVGEAAADKLEREHGDESAAFKI